MRVVGGGGAREVGDPAVGRDKTHKVAGEAGAEPATKGAWSGARVDRTDVFSSSSTASR